MAHVDKWNKERSYGSASSLRIRNNFRNRCHDNYNIKKRKAKKKSRPIVLNRFISFYIVNRTWFPLSLWSFFNCLPFDEIVISHYSALHKRLFVPGTCKNVVSRKPHPMLWMTSNETSSEGLSITTLVQAFMRVSNDPFKITYNTMVVLAIRWIDFPSERIYFSYNLNFVLAIGRIYFLERVYIIWKSSFSAFYTLHAFTSK
jgi:hypothetical protein